MVTQRFAFKCSAQYRDGKWIDIFKKPQDESKASKKGRLILYDDGHGMNTGNIDGPGIDLLKTVFENGIIKNEYSLKEIRNNAKL